MTLSRELFDVVMEHTCPECGTPKRGKGTYFASIARYRCPGCAQSISMSYDDKLKLFAKAEKLLDCGVSGRERRQGSLKRSTGG